MIPVVDIASIVSLAVRRASATKEGNPSSFEENPTVKETAKHLHDAFREYGFCYLTGHGVSQSVLDSVLSSSKAFFELPEATKRKCVKPVDLTQGWVPQETEKLNADRPHADLKEAFNFTPSEEGTWPTEDVPDMRRSFYDVFDEFRQLCYRVLDLLSIALEFKDHSFLRKTHQLISKKDNNTTLRSLYYPTSSTLKEGQISCGEHSDYGSITLLFQDSTGGLQVLGKDGDYHDVAPLPGAVVVNIGDLMQRWTADRYPATKHRVVLPCQAAEHGRARQSLVFFCNPDDHILITCLDGSDKYPPVTARDYLLQRFAEISYR